MRCLCLGSQDVWTVFFCVVWGSTDTEQPRSAEEKPASVGHDGRLEDEYEAKSTLKGN